MVQVALILRGNIFWPFSSLLMSRKGGMGPSSIIIYENTKLGGMLGKLP